MVLDRRRRAAAAPRDRPHGRRARRAQDLRLPVHQRRAAAAPARPLHARRRTSRSSCTSTGCASDTTRPSTARACSTRPSPRSARPSSGLPGHHQLDVLQHRLAQDGARRARLPERRPRCRRHDDLARLRLREGARPGALPRRDRRPSELFREAFADGRRRKWRLNHTPLFLDFLEGKVDFQCTAWAIPSYSVLGWQRPCYLMSDGYVRQLPGARRDDRLGQLRPRQAIPRCANCMAHCGYEPSAVVATTQSLRQSLRAMVSAR